MYVEEEAAKALRLRRGDGVPQEQDAHRRRRAGRAVLRDAGRRDVGLHRRVDVPDRRPARDGAKLRNTAGRCAARTCASSSVPAEEESLFPPLTCGRGRWSGRTPRR